MAVDVWLYYTLAVLILTGTPGPSTLICLTKGVTHGWSSGAVTALGSLCAITIIMTLSFTGLGVVVASSEWVFAIVKWIGAAYLVFLGIKALTAKQESFAQTASSTSAPHPQNKDNADNTTQSTAAERLASVQKVTSFKRHFSNGFIVGASNPKAILFFAALFPQFIDPNANMLTQYLVFASTFVVLELSWLLTYAYLGAKSSTWIFQRGRAKWFNRLTGGVFIGAGALLSTASQS